jgi:3-phenylpropionate/cinnamic acid dioxygenase small subunit
MDQTEQITQARHAIEDALFRYAEAIDTGDIETVGTIFTQGAVVMPNGDKVEGYQPVFELYRDIIIFYDADEQPTPYVRSACSPRTRHVTSNVIYEFDNEVTTAEVRSYFSVYQTLGGQNTIIAGGRYVDRFDKDIDGWHISERRIYNDNFGDMTRHLHNPAQVAQ